MTKNEREFTVSEETRLLEFLIKSLPKSSRNNIKSMLTHREVLIDGRAVTQFDHPLAPGTTVRVVRSAARGGSVRYSPRIIYEDSDFIVIDKPAGLLAVPDGGPKDSAIELVAAYMKSNSRGGQAFVTHRLDRDTSGVLLFSKSERLAEAMQENWNGLVTLRRYDAAAEGVFSQQSGVFRSWLRESKAHIVYSSQRAGDGQEAVTRYAVVGQSAGYTRLSLELETGRKNQIRAQLQEIGHSVAGDKKYGAKTDPIKRLALHADALEIKHPFTGEILRFEAKAPVDFDKIAPLFDEEP